MRILAALVSMVLAAPAFAEVKTEVVTYKDGDTTLKGVLAYDDAKADKRPGVLVVHEWWGCNDYAKERAKKLAALGYVAFALDMYGDGKTTEKPDEAGGFTRPFASDRKLMRQRAAAGLKVLTDFKFTDASRVAAIGYCFGGTVALELARSGANIAAVVPFHAGTLTTPNAEDGKNIKGKVLVCNGADDTFLKPEERAGFYKEMNAAKVDFQFVDYAGAVHSFTNPGADKFNIPGVKYQAAADQRSWEHMKTLFAEAFAKK